jgi:hypothetical protein
MKRGFALGFCTKYVAHINPLSVAEIEFSVPVVLEEKRHPDR